MENFHPARKKKKETHNRNGFCRVLEREDRENKSPPLPYAHTHAGGEKERGKRREISTSPSRAQ